MQLIPDAGRPVLCISELKVVKNANEEWFDDHFNLDFNEDLPDSSQRCKFSIQCNNVEPNSFTVEVSCFLSEESLKL